jgi:hypothetical protein
VIFVVGKEEEFDKPLSTLGNVTIIKQKEKQE